MHVERWVRGDSEPKPKIYFIDTIRLTGNHDVKSHDGLVSSVCQGFDS